MGVNDHVNRKRRSKSTASEDKTPIAFNDYRFVKLDLSNDEKVDFRGQLESGDFEHIDAGYFLSQGYSVKLSPQDDGKTVLCTVVCSDSTHHNAGLLLTGRANDAATAIRVAAYKDGVICDNGNWLAAEYTRRGGPYDIA